MFPEIVVGLLPILLAPSLFFGSTWLAIRSAERALTRAGLKTRRVRDFGTRFNQASVEKLASTLTDDQLFWSRYLPDHNPAAKIVITNELLRRGYSTGSLSHWSPPPSDLTVPPAFPGTMGIATYKTLISRTGLARRAWKIVFVFSLMAFLSGLALEHIYGVPDTFSHNSWATQLEVFENDGIAELYICVKQVAGLSPFVFLSAPIFVAFKYRRRNLRILLLRPFYETELSTPLRQFVVRHLVPAGLVYTLSDPGYRPNRLLRTLAWLPIDGASLWSGLLSVVTKDSIRVAFVRNENSFRRLQCFLLRRNQPSIWSFVFRQAFNVRSKDEWWQPCVAMLMHSSEVILVDLSLVKQGTVWELNQLGARGLFDKCVFISNEGFEIEAVRSLQDHGHGYFGRNMPKVHVYGADGTPRDSAAFSAKLESMMGQALAERGRGIIGSAHVPVQSQTAQ
jgi:hypothetical protein